MPAGAENSARVIVVGNEKGGSGKSTMALNIIVALLKSGFTVASLDTDGRQRSLTRHFENRARWARKTGMPLEMPVHHVMQSGVGEGVREVEAREFAAYAGIIDRLERTVDFIVVDTPASDSHLMRLSHAMADVLVTPVNDSFMDLDVLGHVHPVSFEVAGHGSYAEIVGLTRRERQRVDGVDVDWVVVRNRLSQLRSRNQDRIVRALTALSASLGFRIAAGISERMIFRELFPIGLTALDRLDRKTLGTEPTMSHLAARQEIRDLVAALRLRPHGATDPDDAPEPVPGLVPDSLAEAVPVLAAD